MSQEMSAEALAERAFTTLVGYHELPTGLLRAIAEVAHVHPVVWVAKALWGLRTTMPEALCDELRLEHGCDFAEGARSFDGWTISIARALSTDDVIVDDTFDPYLGVTRAQLEAARACMQAAGFCDGEDRPPRKSGNNERAVFVRWHRSGSRAVEVAPMAFD
jgi:hypothetical protein